MIDWDAQERASSREYVGIRRFMAKWTTGMIPVGRQMKRWKLRHHGCCPFCNEDDEDTNHVLECRADMAIECWDEEQWNLIKGLYKIDTNPIMIMPIIREIEKIKTKQEDSNDITDLPEKIQLAFKE